LSEGSFDRVTGYATVVDTTAAPSAKRSADRAAKRVLDVAFSAVLLLLLLPVFAACCLAIKLESRGPVFYRATRVGWRGHTLRVLKFRKMVDGATGHALTGDVDPRFTRIGRLLARTKLDELPQLWNVLRGQMSLVGPRPEDSGFVALHESEFAEILSVRPGMTGLGQLAFAKEAEILDPGDRHGHYVDRILPQKVHLDLLYARSRSFRGDLRILVWTVLPVIMRVNVAVNRSTGELTVRRRSRSDSSGSTPSR
jgi:lipopolysaccharide/colanic/teichoic acid biosynthesis glycosyltransferase